MVKKLQISIEDALIKGLGKYVDISQDGALFEDPENYVEIEFYSKVFSGKLYAWANEAFLKKICPVDLTTDSEILDFSSEFLNILMGSLKYELLKEGLGFSFSTPVFSNFIDSTFDKKIVKKYSIEDQSLFVCIVYNKDLSRLTLKMEDNILRPGSSLIYAIGEKGGEDDWLIGASPLNDEVINLTKKADESKLKYFDIDDNKLVTIHLGDNDEIKFDLKKVLERRKL